MDLRFLNVLHSPGAPAAGAPAHRPRLSRSTPVSAASPVLHGSRRWRPPGPVSCDGALEQFEGTAPMPFCCESAAGSKANWLPRPRFLGRSSRRGGFLLPRIASGPAALALDAAPDSRCQGDPCAASGQPRSASYGSQVRRLLGDDAAAGPTLLIGAGQLAQAIAPWLTGSELWLSNRLRPGTRARARTRQAQSRTAGARVRGRHRGANWRPGAARIRS